MIAGEEEDLAAEVERLQRAKSDSIAAIIALNLCVKESRGRDRHAADRALTEAKQRDVDVTNDLREAKARLRALRVSRQTGLEMVTLLRRIARAAAQLADDDSDRNWQHLEDLLERCEADYPDVFTNM